MLAAYCRRFKKSVELDARAVWSTSDLAPNFQHLQLGVQMRRFNPIVVFLTAVILFGCNPGQSESTTDNSSNQESNKEHVRQFFESVWSTGDLTNRDSFLSPEYVGHAAGMPGPMDREAWTAWFEGFRAAFPDATFTIEDMVAEGDRVAARITMRGTQTGVLAGIPPTGNAVVVTGMSIERIRDGLIVEGWNENDALGMFMQIGSFPPPPPPM